MMKRIYADNAATTKLDDDAFSAMEPFLREEYANASQAYTFARKPKDALKKSRAIIAECINAEEQEIFFTSGGTESDNWAIKSVAFANLIERPNIITSAVEHKAILNSCAAMKNFGCTVTKLHVDKFCTVNPAELREKILPSTKIISVMFANNEVGTIQPIKALAAIAHEHGKIFHTDAVQAVGHVAIDVKALGVDMLSASAHKFNGPKGIGFLYVRNGLKILPHIDGGGQEFFRRGGTENVAAIVGMAVALKKNIDALESNQEHVNKLERQFLRGLDENRIPYVRNGSQNILPGLISVSFDGMDGESVLHRMDLRGICISTGSACDSQRVQISHVLQAMNLPENLAKGTIRISLGKNNTAADVQAIVAALKKIICSK